MPYIVKTLRHDAEHDHGDGPASWIVLSDVAVAALNEAADQAEMVVRSLIPVSDPEFNGLLLWAKTMPQQGGSVSLPDGTTIEVERRSYSDLCEAVGRDINSMEGSTYVVCLSVLNLYNAAFGSPEGGGH